jgi:hypothetical protein
VIVNITGEVRIMNTKHQDERSKPDAVSAALAAYFALVAVFAALSLAGAL